MNDVERSKVLQEAQKAQLKRHVKRVQADPGFIKGKNEVIWQAMRNSGGANGHSAVEGLKFSGEPYVEKLALDEILWGSLLVGHFTLPWQKGSPTMCQI